MFLRSRRRRKDGKEHRYWSVVENRRVRSGRVAQRQVLFLGEINDGQQAAWRKTLEVFDEVEQRARALSLFPEDREIPADALNAAQVKLQEMELRLRAARSACARAQVGTLRERLLKLGAYVVVSARRVVIHLPVSFPFLASFRQIALSFGALSG
ncbi:MAG: hypothetical protein ACRD3D_15000 [Terriglobia bacterium]